MRLIEYRAKRMDNSKWDYGCTIKISKDRKYFLRDDLNKVDDIWVEVDPDTIDERTDVRSVDENGCWKIYCGDIVMIAPKTIEAITKYGAQVRAGVIYYDRTIPAYVCDCGDCRVVGWGEWNITILGNTTDNPEFLEKRREEKLNDRLANI